MSASAGRGRTREDAECAILTDVRPYDLRHAHATLLIDLDAHPKAISERRGHSEIGVTMNVYCHLFQDKQEQLTNDLDALVERTRTPGTREREVIDLSRA